MSTTCSREREQSKLVCFAEPKTSVRSKPIHIHVEGNGGLAIYDWDGKEFVLREKQNVKAGDLKRIKAVIDENTDIIINRWKEYFAK